MSLDRFRSVDIRIDKADHYFMSSQFAKGGDYNGRTLVVQVTNGGLIESQAGITVNLGWRHESVKNSGLDPFEVVDAAQGIFEISYPREMLNPGRVTAVIQIIDGETITETKNFVIQVEKSPIDETSIVSSNSFTVLQEALIKVNSWNARIDAVEADFIERANNLDATYPIELNSVKQQLAETAKKVFKKNVFVPNEDFGSQYFRCPFITITNNDVIIAGTDIRYIGSQDVQTIDTGIKRSYDGGRTWLPGQKVILSPRNTINSRVMDGTIVCNPATNRVFLFVHQIDSVTDWYTETNPANVVTDFLYIYSDDDGATWSAPISLKSLFPADVVTMFNGYGSGIVMENGTIIIPVQKKNTNNTTPRQASILYSSDNGSTWTLASSWIPVTSDESNVVEYETGKLMMNSRGQVNYRRVYTTSDMGTTWVQHISDKTIEEPVCAGSFMKYNDGSRSFGLFFNPNDMSNRKNMTLQISKDYTTWEKVYLARESVSQGYSCLATKGDRVYILYEGTGELIFEDLSDLVATTQGRAFKKYNDPLKFDLYSKKGISQRGFCAGVGSAAGKWSKVGSISSFNQGDIMSVVFDLYSVSISGGVIKSQSCSVYLSKYASVPGALETANTQFLVTNLLNMSNTDVVLIPTNSSPYTGGINYEIWFKSTLDSCNFFVNVKLNVRESGNPFNGGFIFSNYLYGSPSTFVATASLPDSANPADYIYATVPVSTSGTSAYNSIIATDTTYYVDDAGISGNSGTSSASPLDSIASVLSKIGKNINVNITIRLMNYTKNENINLSNYMGSGTIIIKSDDANAKNVGYARIFNNTINKISINKLNFTSSLNFEGNTTSVVVDRCTGLTYIESCNLQVSSVNGIYARDSIVFAGYGIIDNKTNAVVADWNGQISCYQLKTTDKTTIANNAYYANMGTIRLLIEDGTTPLEANTTKFKPLNGGLIVRSGGLNIQKAGTQGDSTASDVAGLKTDLNALLLKLRNCGLLS